MCISVWGNVFNIIIPIKKWDHKFMEMMDIIKRLYFNKGSREQCVFILCDKLVKKLVVLFLFMQKRLLDYYFLGSVLYVLQAVLSSITLLDPVRLFLIHHSKRHSEESFINYSLT